MKFDMGGLVADLGDAKAIGQIKPLGVEVATLDCYAIGFICG
ncbi:putative aminopeptidase [Helianthus annuus]|uniref:Aminopeptidase n=1 Tax=Helianthus annuus TaxID=4232 RepID=A0A9K3EES9_HELAN|nr:putative aminopeptidase [Helianthus annuus]KAJ0479507.1 putative aminopeptidase [Helianthus annuus]KAJ0847748.1 putative aminopeptidase [Helianthus annuus]KAJ0856690.1 putative aminopeptidase [Helianthus annuus]